MDTNEIKEELIEILKDAIVGVEPNEYLCIEENNSGSVLFVVRGDGQIAGNYYFQSITHIDDIALSDINEEQSFYLGDYDVYKVDLRDPNTIDVFGEQGFFRLGPKFDDIKRRLEDKTMTFEQLFELMRGPKREGRYMGNKEYPKGDVILQKDIQIDVLVENSGQYTWEKRLLGQKGDTVQATLGAHYAIYDNNGQLGLFLLDDDEYKKPLSLGQSIKEKRNQEQSPTPHSSSFKA